MKTAYWILGLIVVGILIWWIWMANADTTLDDTNGTANEDTTNGTDSDEDSLTVNLSTQNNSGQSGQVVMTEVGGKTQVVVTMTGTPYTTPQPAHIHVGACPNPGAVKYPLTNLVAGVSTTTIDATLDDLKAALPLAINVHKSVAESSVYTACGDIKF